MGLIARLAVASIAALAAPALVGAATAEALEEWVVLCAVNNEACTEEDFVHELTAVAPTATLDFGSLGTVKCAASISRDEADRIATLSLGECTQGCSVKAVNLPYSASPEAPNEGDGVLSVFSGGSGQPRLAVKCGSAECVYSDNLIVFDFEGGSPSGMQVDDWLKEQEESFFCPPAVNLKATFEVTTPKAAFVSPAVVQGPVFCTENFLCLQESIVTSFSTELAPETEAVIGPLEGETQVSCTSGMFGMFDENPFEGKGGPWNFKPWLSGCTGPLSSSCEVLSQKMPWAGHAVLAGGGNGWIVVTEGLGEGPPTLKIECTLAETTMTCTYVQTGFPIEFLGGEPATAHLASPFKKTAGTPGFCPLTTMVEADFQVTSTEALYLQES